MTSTNKFFILSTGECGCVAGLISSCKHFFAILHYIEYQVTLGHNKTCTSKKQKWDMQVYQKSKKNNPPTKTVSRIWIWQNSKILTTKKILFWPLVTSWFWCIVLSERLGRTFKSNKWYCQCPPIYSNHIFKCFCHNIHDFLASYCLVYCVKLKFTCKEMFLRITIKAQ